MSNNIVITTVVGITDPGLVRKNNEDTFFIANPDTGQKLVSNTSLRNPVEDNHLLLMVSDGMGGTEGGEVASRLTVRTIKSEIPRLSKRLSPQSRLEAAIEAANRVVWEKKLLDPILRAMGATVTVAFIERGSAYIAEVGDSRAYLLRGERIKQLTTDQTVVQVLLDSGAITPEIAEISHHKNVLLQSVGSQEFLQIAVTSLPLASGDILLLCSDGLHGKLKAAELYEIVRSQSQLSDAAQQLVEEAKRRGGEDNITVVLAKLEGECLKPLQKMRTITDSMFVISRFDPEQEAQPKPKREVRPANFQDLVKTAAVDHFAESEQQRQTLATLGEYGEYILYRKGDTLVVQDDPPEDGHYWLISGRYRIEVKNPDGRREIVAFIVPTTDTRSDEEIQAGLDQVRVKRQFCTASLGMLNNAPRNATIWCEDETNAVLRVSRSTYERFSEILGEKFVTMVRHS
ncbi:MAG: protein phosphatase 2C domain-containing protein [Acidobacteriota bacterium]